MSAKKSSRRNSRSRQPRNPRIDDSFNVDSSGWTTSFWSYVHSDDKAIFGKISHLREDICRIYNFMTGSGITIFKDREYIGWGEQWSSVLQLGITKTTFLMPVVTPNYFESEACRKELLDFYSICQRRGLDDLILPLILSGMERISLESDDEVIKIIANAQFEDLTEIWPRERGGEHWMLAIRDLVAKLQWAEARVEDRLAELLESPVGQEPPGSPEETHPPLDGDGPGVVELMAEFPELAESATDALNLATERFTTFGNAVQSSPLSSETTATDPRAFQRQILLSANSFKEEAREFEEAAAEALEKTTRANTVVTELKQILGTMNEEKYGAGFMQAIGDLSSVGEVADQLEVILREMADMERFSSVLRRELQPARRGIRYLRDAARMVAAWSN